jgi:uncharacterized protein (TIGR02246 family)
MADAEQRVAAYATAWNTHQAAAVAAFFADDADMIMGNSAVVSGRPAIEEWWGAYFVANPPPRPGQFSVTGFRPLAPGVAIIDVATLTGRPGSDDPAMIARRARGTWVMVDEDGEWKILLLRGLPAEGDTSR